MIKQTPAQERRHQYGRYIERAFRVVEMTAILALLKLVAEPEFPEWTGRLLLFAFFAVAFYALEPVFDAVSRHADAGWTPRNVLGGAVMFALTLFAMFVVFMAVYGLASLIAAYSSSH